MSIQVESWSNSARTVRIRGITKVGAIDERHATNSDRSKATTSFRVSDVPLLLNISLATTGVKRGECYVRITLQAGGFDIAALSAGYLTDDRQIQWPPGLFESSTEGPGLIRYIRGTDPAANVNFSETVPTNARWRLISLLVTLVTDANAANRFMQLTFDNTTSDMYQLPAPEAQIAGLTRLYAYGIGAHLNLSPINTRYSIPLPELILRGGDRVNSVVTNMQAGDDIALPEIMMEEWIEE